MSDVLLEEVVQHLTRHVPSQYFVSPTAGFGRHLHVVDQQTYLQHHDPLEEVGRVLVREVLGLSLPRAVGAWESEGATTVRPARLTLPVSKRDVPTQV